MFILAKDWQNEVKETGFLSKTGDFRIDAYRNPETGFGGDRGTRLVPANQPINCC